MMEAFYKIMTRVMVYRLLDNMKETGDEKQHGFIAGKSCHTALMPVVMGAEGAHKNVSCWQWTYHQHLILFIPHFFLKL
jgi:hypothetical protein